MLPRGRLPAGGLQDVAGGEIDEAGRFYHEPLRPKRRCLTSDRLGFRLDDRGVYHRQRRRSAAMRVRSAAGIAIV
jgi:hypothetical protein